MKSCFDGYLTEGCKDCPDWKDGTKYDEQGNWLGIGCGTHYPIDWCPHFRKMMEEETESSHDILSKETEL